MCIVKTIKVKLIRGVNMSEVIIKDGIAYTASNGRMQYNPEFHENHGKKWTKEEYIYMCSMWDGMSKEDIAMALGRTEGTVLSKKHHLKKIGLFDYYKNLGKKELM